MFTNLHDFIFSDKYRIRWRRHFLFWVAWLFYFSGTFFYEQQGLQKVGSFIWIFSVFIKSFSLLVCHVFIVYAVIYLLLPRYAFRSRYFVFFAGLLLTIAITISWAILCYTFLFPLFDAWTGLPSGIMRNNLLWNSLAAGLISALKILAAVISIKLLKRVYLQQKENEKLELENLTVELQLLKAQIHPDFLFSSLDNIYLFANIDSNKASELLLKLSELLSYMLYDGGKEKVELEKELKMMKDYMFLEKISLGEKLEISISLKGDPSGKMIVPLLMLPLIEMSLSCCSTEHLEKTWINLDIRIEADELHMKLINGKSPFMTKLDVSLEIGLSNIKKRLEIYYAGKSELRMLLEPETMITSFSINLGVEKALTVASVHENKKLQYAEQ